MPTPNVSVIDFKFVANKKTDKDEINKAIKLAAANQLKRILGWTDAPNVSIDFNHDSHSSTFHMDQAGGAPLRGTSSRASDMTRHGVARPSRRTGALGRLLHF